jgi:hypothetical protein
MWWIIPSITLLCLFTAVMPVFYFALYRHEGTMQFPRPLRKLALAAAAALVLVMAVRFQARGWAWNWIAAIGPLSNIPYLLLLISISWEVPEEPFARTSPSNLLRIVTQVAVIAWGAWVAFQLVRLPYVAFTYPFMKRIADQVGRSAPSLPEMLTDVLLTFFSQASLLAAPYIVWRSDFGRGAPQRQQI